MTKQGGHPTYEDKEEERDRGFWDPITKIILRCPDCGSQPSTQKDLEEHESTVHGIEPAKAGEDK